MNDYTGPTPIEPLRVSMLGPGVAYWHTSQHVVSFFGGSSADLAALDNRELVIAAACLQHAVDQINDERRRRRPPHAVSVQGTPERDEK